MNTPIGVVDLLERIRDFYLDTFEEILDEHPAAVVEPLLLDGRGDLVTEGVLHLPSRADLGQPEGDDGPATLKVDTAQMIGFEPLELQLSALSLTLYPFQWNRLQLRFPREHFQAAPFQEWFLRWFDSSPIERQDFLGVVHRLGDPLTMDEQTVLSVDLGSAPVQAFEELLETVAACGAATLAIGQFVQQP